MELGRRPGGRAGTLENQCQSNSQPGPELLMDGSSSSSSSSRRSSSRSSSSSSRSRSSRSRSSRSSGSSSFGVVVIITVLVADSTVAIAEPS